jgi:phenylacetate-CoA ligase
MSRLSLTLKYKWLGISNWVVKRAIGPFRSHRRLLNETQWWTQSELDDFQWRCFCRILRHAYETVPFYRRHWIEHGVRPEQIQSPADVSRLPVVTKSDVRAAEGTMISCRFRNPFLRGARTGGSTGTPLMIYRDWRSLGYEHAFVRRQWEWAGIALGDCCAVLMSKVVADPDQKGGKLYQYVPLMHELILSTYHLSRETAIDYTEIIRRFDVKAIVGYPSALSFLARACLDAGVELPLRAALTTSEAITPKMREVINAAFRCPVFDYYGSAERVCYIHTCEQGSYHVIPEYGFTELVPVESPDRPCYKIVSSGFWNQAMPLIRYDMGDIAVKSGLSCSCGRAFPVVDSIDGREGDVICTPSGRQFGVTLMIQMLYVIAGTRYIAESQMIQDALDHITVEYVPTGGFTPEYLEDFRRLILKYIPSELRLDFKKVDACKRTSTGKLRPLVSLLDKELTDRWR